MIYLLALALSLFNGENLTGWAAENDSPWQVEEGALVASGDEFGFLLSDAEFADFQLSIEFWVESTVNSGVFIRCSDRARITPQTCYELNIWDEHPRQEARTGAIVFKFMPPLAQVDTVGRWSRMDVEARGSQIVVSVNGIKTAELTDARSEGGFIALQHWEQGTVKFRNIKIVTLED